MLARATDLAGCGRADHVPLTRLLARATGRGRVGVQVHSARASLVSRAGQCARVACANQIRGAGPFAVTSDLILGSAAGHPATTGILSPTVHDTRAARTVDHSRAGLGIRAGDVATGGLAAIDPTCASIWPAGDSARDQGGASDHGSAGAGRTAINHARAVAVTSAFCHATVGISWLSAGVSARVAGVAEWATGIH